MHPLPPASVTLNHARATLRHPGATEAQVLAACTQLDLRGDAIDRLAAEGMRRQIERKRIKHLMLRSRSVLRIVAAFITLVACVLIAGWWG